MKSILVTGILLLLLTGCGKTEYVTEYRDIYVPIKTKIVTPNRPLYEETDTTYSYLLKVLDYTKVLEYTIKLNNEGTNEKDR